MVVLGAFSARISRTGTFCKGADYGHSISVGLHRRGDERLLAAAPIWRAPALSVCRPQAAEHEHHPHIHAAIHELREARASVNSKDADHDFWKYREDVVKAIDVAVEQLETKR